MKTKIITLCSFIFLIPFIVSAQFEQFPDMEIEYTGSPVVELQKFLNTNNYIVNSTAGEEGSVGYESDYFGVLTQKALSLFQKDSGVLPSAGYFGAKTKAKINEAIQKAEEGDLSLSLLAGTQKYTYNVNYDVKATLGAGKCRNQKYTPVITSSSSTSLPYTGSSNVIGPFPYPVKMTFTGTIDDNLMINGVIVDKSAELRGDPCSHRHYLSNYTQNFAANTPIAFHIIDNYGGTATMVGTITVEKSSKKLTISPTGPGQIKTTITSLGKTNPPQLITGLTTIEVLEGDSIALEAQANIDANVVEWTDTICQKIADPNQRYLRCKSYPITITSTYTDKTVSATFKKKVNKCNVIAYGGYGSSGVFESKVKAIVDTFNKGKLEKVKFQQNQFNAARDVVKDAKNRIAGIPQNEKILFAAHSISSIGFWNGAKKGEIPGTFDFLLFDPPYQLDLYYQEDPAGLIGRLFGWITVIGNADAIKDARGSKIAEAPSVVINWTCGYRFKFYRNCPHRTEYRVNDPKSDADLKKAMQLDHERYNVDYIKALARVQSWLENSCQ